MHNIYSTIIFCGLVLSSTSHADYIFDYYNNITGTNAIPATTVPIAEKPKAIKPVEKKPKVIKFGSQYLAAKKNSATNYFLIGAGMGSVNLNKSPQIYEPVGGNNLTLSGLSNQGVSLSVGYMRINKGNIVNKFMVNFINKKNIIKQNSTCRTDDIPNIVCDLAVDDTSYRFSYHRSSPSDGGVYTGLNLIVGTSYNYFTKKIISTSDGFGSLTNKSSTLTTLSLDIGFDWVFSKQVILSYVSFINVNNRSSVKDGHILNLNFVLGF